MTTTSTTLIRKSVNSILGLALMSSLVLGAPLLAADGPAAKDSENAQAVHDHAAMNASSPAKLVQLVRAATCLLYTSAVTLMCISLASSDTAWSCSAARSPARSSRLAEPICRRFLVSIRLTVR